MTEPTPTKRPTRKPRKEAPVKAAEPMDPDAVETPVPVLADGTQDPSRHAPFSKRNCWAVEVLLAEVKALYPEVTHTITDVTGRQVGYEVEFTGWDAEHEGNEPGLPEVLATIEGDHRVQTVESHTPLTVTVRFWANPVTMDIRDPFNLADAYAILADGE